MSRDDEFARLAAEYADAVADVKAADDDESRAMAALEEARRAGAAAYSRQVHLRRELLALVPDGGQLIADVGTGLVTAGWTRSGGRFVDYDPTAPAPLAGVAVTEGSP
jgi:hypothetical protein